jgi:hypothetical protein
MNSFRCFFHWFWFIKKKDVSLSDKLLKKIKTDDETTFLFRHIGIRRRL